MPGGFNKTFFVQCVRGNASYALNSFADNGNGTVTGRAAGLMWAQSDSSTAMNWQDALAWVQTKNASSYLGYSVIPGAEPLIGDWFYLKKRSGSCVPRGSTVMEGITLLQMTGRTVEVADSNFTTLLTGQF